MPSYHHFAHFAALLYMLISAFAALSYIFRPALARYAVRNTSEQNPRRLLWTVPVSKDQRVVLKADGGQCKCQFIPFGK